MATMTIDQTFNQKCNVADSDPYGYEPAAPSSSNDDPYGYGDAAPDGDKYGYGDAAPDAEKYGYGDAAPDTGKYGYGDAAPDNNDKYGYGDATPDGDKYGYGDATPDTDKYGYGSGAPAAADLGYEDPDAAADSNPYGYELDNVPRRNAPLRSHSTHSTHSTSSAEYGYGDDGGEVRRRRERPRRRGSVTKYSLDAQNTVAQEFDAHTQAIEQLRSGAAAAQPPPPPPGGEEAVPLKKGSSRGTPRRSRSSDDVGVGAELSEDDDISVEEMSCEDGADKKKKKKRFGRFRIGRNRSGMSTESNASGS